MQFLRVSFKDISNKEGAVAQLAEAIDLGSM